MRHLRTFMCLLAGVCLASCAKQPTRAELLRLETESLRVYCTGDAQSAERALIECEQYLQECRDSKLEGIVYDEDFARIYGRLYLLEKHSGKLKETGEYFQKAAECRERMMRENGNAAAHISEAQMRDYFDRELDRDLRVAWRTNVIVRP